MPEFPFVQSGYAQTVGSTAASTQGTTLTANASANTKGTYVQLIAATERDSNWILVQLANCSVGQPYLVDVSIGASTEQIILPDLWFTTKTNADSGPYLFPIFVPAGSRITARCQCVTGAATCEILVHLFSGTNVSGGAQPSIASAYGAVTSSIGTNIDPGAVANTDSAWTQMTAATDRAHNWLCVAIRAGDQTIAAATRWLVDIGIGAATEQEIVGDLCFSGEASGDSTFCPVVCFPYFVPSGARLTARARSSVTTDGDRDIWLKIYGA